MNSSTNATKRWWYIMPIVFITYSLAYLDRANFSFASAAGITEDLGITKGISSLLGALFFLGYFFFQIPGAIYAERRSVRKLIFICLILWGVALAGVLAKMLWINAPRMLSTAVYLIMGWSVVFVAKDFTALGQPCLTLVALGGICYSVGAVFYAVKKPNISAEWTFHELFHLLILAGSFFHYLAVYLYVL